MIVYTTVAFIGSLACCALGVYVLLRDRRKALNRLFFLMSLSLAGFVFLANACSAADTLAALTVSYKIAALFFGSYFALNLHFNLVFTGHPPTFRQCLILYLPVPVVIVTTLFDYSLFSDFVRQTNGWNFVPAYRNFGLYFYLAYGLSYMLASILLVELYRRRTVLKKEKLAARIINGGYFVAMTAGTAFAFFLPLLNVYWLSPFGPDTFLVYYFAIYYAVFKFRFLMLTPAVMADEIIAHIGETVVLLDRECRIITINDTGARVLGIGPERAKGVSLLTLVRERADFERAVASCLVPGAGSLRRRISFLRDGDIVTTEASLSRITDKFGDHTGFLLIARRDLGRQQVQKACKISDREFEVIELVLAGLSNKAIGEKLAITERTVEAHCLHIYGKIGVKDRIELFTFAVEFDLLPKK
jgi:PAS domain S-box-containing protein